VVDVPANQVTGLLVQLAAPTSEQLIEWVAFTSPSTRGERRAEGPLQVAARLR
jgi:hypothetical protein